MIRAVLPEGMCACAVLRQAWHVSLVLYIACWQYAHVPSCVHVITLECFLILRIAESGFAGALCRASRHIFCRLQDKQL